jgi:Holliday junction resolvase RusA-like endonuclease
VAEVKIILSGEPKSMQHIYKFASRGNFPSMYMTKAGKEFKAQWRQPPLKVELAVSVRFFFGTKRKADLDNFNKLWQDALSGIVYDDDSQIAELHLYRDYDKAKPGIQVCIGPK